MDNINILGTKISKISRDRTLSLVDDWLRSSEFHHIVTPNPEFVVLANKDKNFQTIINNADLSIADGTGIILAAKYLHTPLPVKITGTDLIPEIAKLARDNNQGIFLLGAQPGIAELAQKVLEEQIPGLQVAGATSGPNWHDKKELDNPDIQNIVQQIKNSGAAVLIVAFGAPKQEWFIDQFRNELGVKIAIGVGGAFDYIAGITPRAPRWMRQIGLEWLYRLFTQPKRIGRIWKAVIVFPVMVLLNGKNIK